jgi:hypothetical protein
MTQEEAEAIFKANLGVTKFIWLDGVAGDPIDITDMHIDGFVKFANDTTLVTMSADDLTYWGVPTADINTIQTATNINDIPYNQVTLPLTQNDVSTTKGKSLGYKGSYVNYYVANEVVLIPFYNDPNDMAAMTVLQPLYPDRQIIGIDCRNLYEWGGMVHCVTQQQPVLTPVTGSVDPPVILDKFSIYPNPVNDKLTLKLISKGWKNGSVQITNINGERVFQQPLNDVLPGETTHSLNMSKLTSGTYLCTLWGNGRKINTLPFVLHHP